MIICSYGILTVITREERLMTGLRVCCCNKCIICFFKMLFSVSDTGINQNILIYFIVSLWSSLLCTFSPSVSCHLKGWVYPRLLKSHGNIIKLFFQAECTYSPLWGCAVDWVKVVVKVHCGTVKNSFPKTVPQCTLEPSQPGLPRNLKVANGTWQYTDWLCTRMTLNKCFAWQP